MGGVHSIRHKFLPHLLNYKRKSNAECTEHMSDDLRLRHSLRAKCFVAWMFFFAVEYEKHSSLGNLCVLQCMHAPTRVRLR